MQLQQYSLGAGQKGSHQAPITGHNHRLLVSLNKTLVHFSSDVYIMRFQPGKFITAGNLR